MKLPPMTTLEAWASGFQWGILLVLLTATAPGNGWAFYVWLAGFIGSSLIALTYQVKLWKMAFRKPSALEVKEDKA